MRTHYRNVVAGLLICLGALVLWTGHAAAGAQDVNQQLRNAEKLYFRGNIQEADALLKEVEQQTETILQGTDAKEQQKIKRLESKMKKLRSDIDRKLKSSAAMPAAPAAPEAKPTGGTGELPSYVVQKIKSIHMGLDNVQGFIDKGALNPANNALKRVEPQISRLEKSYAEYLGPDHPELKKLKDRFAQIETSVATLATQKAQGKAALAEDSARSEAASDQWIERLKPYAIGLGRPGHDPQRYFVGSYTADGKEMAQRTSNYEKVKALMAQWQDTGLADAATDELQQMVKDLRYQVKSFEESCTMMADTYLGEAERKIERLKPRIENELKKIGSGDMPAVMHKNAFQDIRRSLDCAAGLLGKDDSRVVALTDTYNDLLAKNGKLVEARIEETRMLADRFSGSQKNEIKNKAEEVLKVQYAGIKLLRTNVVSDDWKEESVIEWTDTTRSALRHRVTQSVSAQVAGQLNGETKLYTLFVGKNRLTDGGWSQLQGHVMFVDPILEKNVPK